MIQFTDLLAENVGPFETLALSLKQRGLVLILGDNRDTTAADNNGSGKSHVMKAVSWVLWGKTPDDDKVDKLTRNGQSYIMVSLAWEDEDGQWAVKRTKKRSASVQLELEHNGQDVSAPTVEMTQAEVGKRLGMDFQTWRNTVLYAQGDVVRFADPATTDSERKLILKRILRLDTLDRALEQARARAKAVEQTKLKLVQEAGTILAELRGLGELVDIQVEITDAETEAKQYMVKAKPLERFRKVEQQIIDVLDEINTRLDEAAAAREEATKHALEATAEEGSVARAQADVRRADSALKLFASGACPTCGSKSTSPGVKSKVAALNEERGIAEVAWDQSQALASLHRKSAAEAKARAETVTSEVKAEAAEWHTKLATAQKGIREAEHALVVAKAAQRRADQAKAKLKTIVERRTALEERGREIALESDQLTVELGHIEFWVKGFSNAGLSSYLMDAIMPSLTERANHYLSILADGDITVNFDTQSKLKSGESREKLSISWTIEGEQDTTPSGGQRKKISIAVDLALMDIVAARERSAVDLLLMDEMLDGLDTTGRSRVMTLLGELREKRSSIFVISHDSSIAELFETTMTVRKTGRVAELLEDVT